MRQTQTVTVFMDAKSRKNLEFQGIAAEEMLALATRNFLAQGIHIRYDLNSLKIKNWPGIKFAWVPEVLTPEWLFRETKEIAEKMREVLLREFNQRHSNIVMVFAGHILRGSGRAFENTASSDSDGGGLIILGTYPDPLAPANRKKVLEGYAKVVMHEHGHLYGLGHVSQKNTLMYPFGDGMGINLDKRSKRTIQRILQRKTAS